LRDVELWREERRIFVKKKPRVTGGREEWRKESREEQKKRGGEANEPFARKDKKTGTAGSTFDWRTGFLHSDDSYEESEVTEQLDRVGAQIPGRSAGKMCVHLVLAHRLIWENDDLLLVLLFCIANNAQPE
jgi:hypothetical protein